MADYVPITAGSGTDIGAENLTISGTAVYVQQTKQVLGAQDVYGGEQGGRLVDQGAINLVSVDTGSFESSTGGFTATTNCSVSQSATKALDGTHSLRLSSTASGTMEAGTASGTSGYAVTPGVQYTATSEMIAGASGRVVVCQIAWYNAAGSLISASTGPGATDNTSTWVQNYCTDVAPPGAVYAAIFISVNSTSASSELHYIDEVGFWVGNNLTWVAGQALLPLNYGSAAAAYVDSRLASADVTKTPTISTSAYTIGFVLGGVIDFGAIARASGGGVSILSATILDKAQKNAQIDLFLFNANPSNGTYTDHAAPTVSTTDLLMCRGVISFSAYANFGTSTVVTGVCSVPNVGLDIVLNGTQHLYGIMLIRTAVTYATTSDITVTLEYVPD